MILTHKMEIKPNKTIIKLFEKYFGYSRYCYNKGLSIWEEEYSKGNKPNGRKVRDIFKSIKQEWEKEYSPVVLDTAIEDLEKAYNMFYKKINKKPKFKSKKINKNSFRVYRKCDSTIRIKHNKLYLPRFPYGIKLTENIRFNGTIKTCTITKKANRYFASFSIELKNETEIKNKFPTTNKVAGIDLGLKTFAVLADDKYFYKYFYPSKLKAYYAKINYLNRKLSKKQKGSNKFNVMKTKLQRTYLRIFNIQMDFLQKLTTNIIKNYDKRFKCKWYVKE